jgi:hypothetical protein
MALLCIYCGSNAFEQGKGSEEHAILSSIGGRKASRNICCTECNNTLGDDIDALLSESLALFSNLIGITKDRGSKSAPTIKSVTEIDGNPVDMTPGGELKYSKSIDNSIDTGSETQINIRANSKDQAYKILEGKLRQKGLALPELEKIEAKSIKKYPQSFYKEIQLGGSERYRSVAKMALTYAATFMSPDRLRGHVFNRVVSFIKAKDLPNEFVRFYVGQFPTTINTEAPTHFCHRIVVGASSDKRKVHAVVELFGHLSFFVKLSDCWDGPDLSKTYIVDPVTGQQSEIESSANPSLFNIKVNSKVKITDVLDRLNALVRKIESAQSNMVIARIIDDAINNHLIDKGEVLTEDMLQGLAEEIALKFTQFAFRIDSEESIQLK